MPIFLYILVFDDGEEVEIIDWESILSELEKRPNKKLSHILEGTYNMLDEFVPRRYFVVTYEDSEIFYEHVPSRLLVAFIDAGLKSKILSNVALSLLTLKFLNKEINK